MKYTIDTIEKTILLEGEFTFKELDELRGRYADFKLKQATIFIQPPVWVQPYVQPYDPFRHFYVTGDQIITNPCGTTITTPVQPTFTCSTNNLN